MKKKEVTVVFNYRSPFCALIVSDIFALQRRYDINLKWLISRDVPRPSSLPVTVDNPRFSYNRQDCLRRAAWAGLRWSPPDWRLTDVDAASLLGQWLLASQSPFFEAYTIRASRAYWSEGLDLSDKLVVERIALEVGLTRAQIEDAWADNEATTATLDANARWCAESGVLGVPFFIADDQKFWGSDRFGAVERYLADQKLGPLPVVLEDGVLFAGAPIPTVPVAGRTVKVAVNRIFCVGRNYAEHAREMGKDPDRDPPFFFMKPAGAIVLSGETIPYPRETANYHYEMELVVVLGRPLRNATLEQAADAIYGYAAGLDMTRRDLQLEARDKGRPWELGKSFEQSAVIGLIKAREDLMADPEGRIFLAVDDETRQSARVSDLIWSVPEILENLSRYFDLQPGDVIYTGTPAGVGAVQPGMTLHGEVEGIGSVDCTIGA